MKNNKPQECIITFGDIKIKGYAIITEVELPSEEFDRKTSEGYKLNLITGEYELARKTP